MLKVYSTVKMTQVPECLHRDPRDCFHQACLVRHIFRERDRALVENADGYVRICFIEDLKVIRP